MKNTEEILRSRKLRSTPVRLAVYECFVQHGAALNHSDLEQSLPGNDRITLYRTLKSFEDAGILHSFRDEKGEQRYALCKDECVHHVHRDEHLHFHCVQCARYFCLPHVVFSPTLPQGFVLQELQLTAQGLCDSCAVIQAS